MKKCSTTLSVLYNTIHSSVIMHLASCILNQFNQFSHFSFQALDTILKALSLCSSLENICAKYHEEHGDILKDMEDFESAEEVRYFVQIHLNI